MEKRSTAGALVLALLATPLGGCVIVSDNSIDHSERFNGSEWSFQCGVRQVRLGYAHDAGARKDGMPAPAANARLMYVQVDGQAAAREDRNALAAVIETLDTVDGLDSDCGGPIQPMTLTVSGRRGDAPVDAVFIVRPGRLIQS